MTKLEMLVIEKILKIAKQTHVPLPDCNCPGTPSEQQKKEYHTLKVNEWGIAVSNLREIEQFCLALLEDERILP